jgi:diguanylate cyclase (GGDEF)-like protein
MASIYFSLDVLYCLPVIQTAHYKALQSQPGRYSHLLSAIAIICAIAWSIAEAAVAGPDFPISAFLMNVITRAVTFTIIGRVIAQIWKDKENSRKDVLTGLANRVEFIRWFEEKQLLSKKSGKPYSLLFINIDNFRALNDTLGHKVGDMILQNVASIILENSRGIDGSSRIGSDEFVLLFADADEQMCSMMTERIIRSLEERFIQNGWDISLSYGHITDVGNSRSVHELLRDADENMLLHKNGQDELKN